MITTAPGKRRLRAAIYARYSSELQRETSIEDQVRVCRARAEALGADIGNIYTDAAISGSKITNRPGIQSLLNDARAVPPKFDKIGRAHV